MEMDDEEPERVEMPTALREIHAAAPDTQTAQVAVAAVAQPAPACHATKSAAPAAAPPATSAGFGYLVPTVFRVLAPLAVVLYVALFCGESSALIVV